LEAATAVHRSQQTQDLDAEEVVLEGIQEMVARVRDRLPEPLEAEAQAAVALELALYLLLFCRLGALEVVVAFLFLEKELRADKHLGQGQVVLGVLVVPTVKTAGQKGLEQAARMAAAVVV
jgi:hypothetical protein